MEVCVVTSDAIIVALITGACAVISQIVISAKSTRELYSKLDKQSEIADERIKSELAVIKVEMAELRKQVEKHNSVVERTYSIEKELEVQKEQIKVANNRLKDLETAAVK